MVVVFLVWSGLVPLWSGLVCPPPLVWSGLVLVETQIQKAVNIVTC